MRILLRHMTILLGAAVLLFFGGCTLDEPGTTSQLPALTLTHEQNLSLTVLSWDRVNVTGFKEYILLQSHKPIPDSPTPEVSQDVSILKRIDDLDITSHAASPTLLSPQICFKLYCDIGERFLFSANLCMASQIDALDGFYDRGCHLSGHDEAVLFDRINNTLATVNYKTGIITNLSPELFLNFPSLEMSTWANETNVFGMDQSPPWMIKYTFPSLIDISSKNYSDIIWSANVHNQFVFLTSQEFNRGFQILSRTTLNRINSRIGMLNNQHIAVFPGTPITVLTLGPTESRKYLVDEAGFIIGEESIPARILQPDQQHNCAEGTTLFIGGSNGSIINAEGNNVGTLNPSTNSFIQMSRLTLDESKAVYLLNVNGEIHLEIADLTNLPAVTVLSSFVVPAISYADIIPDGDIIYLIGTTFSNAQPLTFIMKYPLQP